MASNALIGGPFGNGLPGPQYLYPGTSHPLLLLLRFSEKNKVYSHNRCTEFLDGAKIGTCKREETISQFYSLLDKELH